MEQPFVETREQTRDWHAGVVVALLLGYFVLVGLLVGGQGVLWAEILTMLNMSKGTFGTAQLVPSLMSVALLLIGGTLSAWAGKKGLILAALLLLVGANLGLAMAGNLWSFVGALALSGAGVALLDLAMNGATLDWEHAIGRSIMNVMHAGFSAGAMIGAALAGVLLRFGWSYGMVFGLLAGACLLLTLLSLPARYPPADAAEGQSHDLGSTMRLVFSHRVLLVLALLCLLSIVGESVANLWTVIYIRDELQGGAFVAGLAFAAFNGAMLVGRLLNATIVARFNNRVSLAISSVAMILAGLLLVPPFVPTTFVAFAMLGLAVAGVIPTAISAAAKRSPGNSGAVAGGIMAFSYVGFVIVPPSTGWLAQLTSLHTALLIVGVCGAAMIWLVRGVQE